MTREEARKRNWLKARYIGFPMPEPNTPMTSEEKAIVQKIYDLKSQLIDTWDKNSQKLGFNVITLDYKDMYRDGGTLTFILTNADGSTQDVCLDGRMGRKTFWWYKGYPKKDDSNIMPLKVQKRLDKIYHNVRHSVTRGRYADREVAMFNRTHEKKYDHYPL